MTDKDPIEMDRALRRMIAKPSQLVRPCQLATPTTMVFTVQIVRA